MNFDLLARQMFRLDADNQIRTQLIPLHSQTTMVGTCTFRSSIPSKDLTWKWHFEVWQDHYIPLALERSSIFLYLITCLERNIASVSC